MSNTPCKFEKDATHSCVDVLLDTLPPFYQDIFGLTQIVVQLKRTDPEMSAKLAKISKSITEQFEGLKDQAQLRGVGDNIEILTHRCGEGSKKIANQCGACLIAIDRAIDKKCCEVFGCPGKYLCTFDRTIESKTEKVCGKCSKKFCSLCEVSGGDGTCGVCAGNLAGDPRVEARLEGRAESFWRDFRAQREESRDGGVGFQIEDPSENEISDSYTEGRRLYDVYAYRKDVNRLGVLNKNIASRI